VFGEEYFPPPIEQWGPERLASSTAAKKEAQYRDYYRQTIKFWDLLGYPLYADLTFTTNFESLNPSANKAADTAGLSKGDRYWANEGSGVIRSWEDFERFPWDRAYRWIEEYQHNLAILRGLLPDTMKIGAVGTLFEEPLEWILGYEGLFFLLADQPELVAAVFEKVGEINLAFYNSVIEHDSVGCIFHADDLGFKTGTFLSVSDLKRLVFPWLKKYASVAHAQGKPFFLHSCGNKEWIMDILIDDVGIDAIHSFEDASYPVTAYKKKWGRRVGIIGGADVDVLCRSSRQELRRYLRALLDSCMEGGRYAFGSGNTITNYTPVENYLIMLEEAANWP
jgi:uroporphyrinogen decarboxylase